MKKIMIVKRTDLAGTSVKHIEIPKDTTFIHRVYIEVTSTQLKKRSYQYWGNK